VAVVFITMTPWATPLLVSIALVATPALAEKPRTVTVAALDTSVRGVAASCMRKGNATQGSIVCAPVRLDWKRSQQAGLSAQAADALNRKKAVAFAEKLKMATSREAINCTLNRRPARCLVTSSKQKNARVHARFIAAVELGVSNPAFASCTFAGRSSSMLVFPDVCKSLMVLPAVTK
jgi:hypothetical protein